MRDRLIELIKDLAPDMVANCGDECDTCSHGDCIGELADHLLAEGVIVLPIPYGTELHFLWSRSFADKPKPPCVHSTKDWIFNVRDDGKMWLTSNDIPVGYYGEHLHQLGKTVFLTREEAEKALKERSENGT